MPLGYFILLVVCSPFIIVRRLFRQHVLGMSRDDAEGGGRAGFKMSHILIVIFILVTAAALIKLAPYIVRPFV
jgi:hypothetical protein